jgi:hypothetical protein
MLFYYFFFLSSLYYKFLSILFDNYYYRLNMSQKFLYFKDWGVLHISLIFLIVKKLFFKNKTT